MFLKSTRERRRCVECGEFFLVAVRDKTSCLPCRRRDAKRRYYARAMEKTRSERAAADIIPNETWAAVSGFDGLYEVSDQGRVRSLRSGRLMHPYPNNRGYLYVNLRRRKGPIVRQLVHRLVASAFLRAPGPGEVVNHLDETPTHNLASNLEWVTQADNLTYSRRRRPMAKQPRR